MKWAFVIISLIVFIRLIVPAPVFLYRRISLYLKCRSAKNIVYIPAYFGSMLLPFGKANFALLCNNKLFLFKNIALSRFKTLVLNDKEKWKTASFLSLRSSTYLSEIKAPLCVKRAAAEVKMKMWSSMLINDVEACVMLSPSCFQAVTETDYSNTLTAVDKSGRLFEKRRAATALFNYIESTKPLTVGDRVYGYTIANHRFIDIISRSAAPMNYDKSELKAFSRQLKELMR